MQLEIESLEEANMENVAILKEENKKLQKKLKEALKGETSPVPTKQSTRQKQVSARETAALSVEHDLLTKQVAQMKDFIRVNEQKVPESPTPDMEETMTYATAKQALNSANEEEHAAEVKQLKEENETLIEQMEEIRLQYHTIENQLVESKLLSAQLDMECD